MNFDARVVGLPNYLRHIKEHLDKENIQFETKKFDRVRRSLQKKHDSLKDECGELFKREASAVSHVYFERYGLLTPLQEWATAKDGTTPELVVKENAWTECLHLVLLGQNEAVVLPLEFSDPFEIELERQKYGFPVCSAQKLAKELESANKSLKVEKTFQTPQIPDFVSATRHETRKLEKEADLDDTFWLKFGFVVLRHLVQKSLEHKLPVIISVRSLEPAV